MITGCRDSLSGNDLAALNFPGGFRLMPHIVLSLSEFRQLSRGSHSVQSLSYVVLPFTSLSLYPAATVCR